MYSTDDEIREILTQLPPPRRVGIACIAVEHLLELYRLGHVKAVAGPGISGVAPGTDLVDAGLELAWRYATGAAIDGDRAQAIRKALEKLRKQLLDRLYGSDSKEPLLGVLLGPIIGVSEALLAIDAKKWVLAANALDRPTTSVSDLVKMFTDVVDDEDDVVHEYTEEMHREAAWQLKVARRMRDLGDKPIDRAAFKDLLAEKLRWHSHLDAFAKRAATAGKPDAATAGKSTAKPAKPATKKPAKPAPKRPTTSSKPKSKPKPAKKTTRG